MKSRNKIIFSLVFLFSFLTSLSARPSKYEIKRLEPPFWWTGMMNHNVQLLVYGVNIADLIPQINYPGLKISEVVKVSNPNYLFIYLKIGADTKPGKLPVDFLKNNKKEVSYNFQLFERELNSSQRQGFNSSDVMYLITPDRFVNGTPENDNIPGMADTLNRQNPGGRHGGDIQGISQSLNYLKEMGFTAIWVNPVIENNMPEYSYHGYAATDFYKVDARFGTNEEYRQLSLAAKEKGIKMIMDMIFNHCGSEHWWMKDLPSADWINFDGKFVPTNHKRSLNQDPYASKYDKNLFSDGWFVETMPDLNQRNPLMADYLIQNSIWWIENAALNGIRMDTYCYPDKDFMASWTCAVMNEYPNFNTVGEEWSENPAIVAFWQRGKVNPNGYTSCLPGVMDFPLQGALARGLTNPENMHSQGFVEIYQMLANDFLYADPSNLVIFPDNHDMSRFFTQVNEDFGLYKMGITFILTMRGIPQIYYGTEVLMSNPGTTSDGIIRSDFPGGWKGDKINAFNETGLTAQQKEAKAFMKTLLNYRKKSEVLQHGKLMHFAPENGIYAYFRYDENGVVMVVMNKNEEAKLIDRIKFDEVISDYKTGKDIISQKIIDLDKLTIPARSVLVLELSK
jgi:glycosidase